MQSLFQHVDVSHTDHAVVASATPRQAAGVWLWPGRSISFLLSTQSVFTEISQAMDCGCQHVESISALVDHLNVNTLGCLIVDYDSLSMPLAEVTSQLWQKMVAFPVIVMSSRTDVDFLQEVVTAGVTRIVSKPLDVNMLNEAIEQACLEDDQGDQSPRDLRRRLGSLTDREREVLSHCLRGSPAKVVAKRLGVTFQTVDKHRARALCKLSVGSLLEFVQVLSNRSNQSLLRYV